MRHDFPSTLAPIPGAVAWMVRPGALSGPADAADTQFFLQTWTMPPRAPNPARARPSHHYRAAARLHACGRRRRRHI